MSDVSILNGEQRLLNAFM